MIVTVPKGRNNKTSLSIGFAGQPFDFAGEGITSVIAYAGGKSLPVTFEPGVIHMQLGQFDLPAGRYNLEVVMYGTNSPDGTTIIAPGLATSVVMMMQNSPV